MRQLYLFIIALLVVFGQGVAFTSDTESLAELAKELGLQILPDRTKAPDFELETTDGTVVKLSSYRGQMVFLNFWAVWCPPCRAEMPSMQELYEQFSDKGLVMLAVDLQESKVKVVNFMEDYGFEFQALLDISGQVGRRYGIRNIPTTYLIDPIGNVIAAAIGAREWSSTAAIRYFSLLLETPIAAETKR